MTGGSWGPTRIHPPVSQEARVAAVKVIDEDISRLRGEKAKLEHTIQLLQDSKRLLIEQI